MLWAVPYVCHEVVKGMVLKPSQQHRCTLVTAMWRCSWQDPRLRFSSVKSDSTPSASCCSQNVLVFLTLQQLKKNIESITVNENKYIWIVHCWCDVVRGWVVLEEIVSKSGLYTLPDLPEKALAIGYDGAILHSLGSRVGEPPFWCIGFYADNYSLDFYSS